MGGAYTIAHTQMSIHKGAYTMSKTLAIINQKGGVGKSTTVQALAAGLTLKGFKVLTVDLDPQGNTTFSLGARKDGATALGVLLEEVKPADAIQHTKYGDIIAGSKALAGADAYLTETGKEYKLREALEQVSGGYDYVLIDTPPALGILTTNALTACTSVIIPAQADIYSLQGIADLADTMKPVKKYCNPALEIEGILFTRYSPRSAFSKELAELAGELAGNLGTKVFTTMIREAVAVKKAQAVQQSVFEYEPKAKVTEDYKALIEELLREER